MTDRGSTVERLIGRLKAETGYRFGGQYTRATLMRIVYYRALQVLRGCWHRAWIQMPHGMLFAGRGVVIEYGSLLRAGPQLFLEDGVFINALAEQGITFGRNCTVGTGSKKPSVFNDD